MPSASAPSVRPTMRARWITLAVVLAALVAGLASAPPTSAQGGSRGRRRAAEPPPVPYDAAVQWTVFVSAHGDQAARRTVASAEPGSILVPMEGWQCTYSAPTRAQVNATNWSEVRTLECSRGDAIVSTTGFCQISGASWGARAGVLSLGARGDASRVQVTVDCSVIE